MPSSSCYELYERQFDDQGNEEAIETADLPFAVNVSVPQHKSFKGYDVVTFYGGAGPECSSLSCNSLAREHDVNQHCLLTSLGEAISLLRQGAFEDSESGPYRIFSVYSL